jgi:hypothetical protein
MMNDVLITLSSSFDPPPMGDGAMSGLIDGLWWMILGAVGLSLIAIMAYQYLMRRFGGRRAAAVMTSRAPADPDALAGTTLHADADHSFDEQYPHFACLRQGVNRYAYNIHHVDAADGRIIGFDYHFELHDTGTTISGDPHQMFSAVIVPCPFPLQGLLIREESTRDRLAALAGYDDIDFDSHDFSERYFVQAAERRWAYDVLHHRAIQWLLDRETLNIQFGPFGVIGWLDRTFMPGQYEHAAQTIVGLLERMPAYTRRWVKDKIT